MSAAKVRRPGRPREIGVTREAEERVKVRLPDLIYDWYAAAAIRNGDSLATALRRALIAFYDHRHRFRGPDNARPSGSV